MQKSHEETMEMLRKEAQRKAALKKPDVVLPLQKDFITKVTEISGWPEWIPCEDNAIWIQIEGLGELFNETMGANAPEERLYQFATIDPAERNVYSLHVWDHGDELQGELWIEPAPGDELGKELYRHMTKLDPSIEEEVVRVRKEELKCAS